MSETDTPPNLSGDDLARHGERCRDAVLALGTEHADRLAVSERSQQTRPDPWPIVSRLMEAAMTSFRRQPVTEGAPGLPDPKELIQLLQETVFDRRRFHVNGEPSTGRTSGPPILWLGRPDCYLVEAKAMDGLNMLTSEMLLLEFLAHADEYLWMQPFSTTHELTVAEAQCLVRHNSRAQAPLNTILSQVRRARLAAWKKEHSDSPVINRLGVPSSPALFARPRASCNLPLFHPRTGAPIDPFTKLVPGIDLSGLYTPSPS